MNQVYQQLSTGDFASVCKNAHLLHNHLGTKLYYSHFYDLLQEQLTILKQSLNDDIVSKIEPILSRSLLVDTLIKMLEDVYTFVGNGINNRTFKLINENLHSLRVEIDNILSLVIESVSTRVPRYTRDVTLAIAMPSSIAIFGDDFSVDSALKLLNINLYGNDGSSFVYNSCRDYHNWRRSNILINIFDYLLNSLITLSNKSIEVIQSEMHLHLIKMLLHKSINYLMINWLIDYFYYQNIILFFEPTDEYHLKHNYALVERTLSYTIKVFRIFKNCEWIMERGMSLGHPCNKPIDDKIPYCKKHFEEFNQRGSNFNRLKYVYPLCELKTALITNENVLLNAFYSYRIGDQTFVVRWCETLYRWIAIAKMDKSGCDMISYRKIENENDLVLIRKENLWINYSTDY